MALGLSISQASRSSRLLMPYSRTSRLMPAALVDLAEDVVVAEHQQGRRRRPSASGAQGALACARASVALGPVGHPEGRPGAEVERQRAGPSRERPAAARARGRRRPPRPRPAAARPPCGTRPWGWPAARGSSRPGPGVELLQLAAQAVDGHPHRGVLRAVEGWSRARTPPRPPRTPSAARPRPALCDQVVEQPVQAVGTAQRLARAQALRPARRSRRPPSVADRPARSKRL